MGKKKILSLVVTALLTLNMTTVVFADSNNEVTYLNSSGTRKESPNKPIVQAPIPESYKVVCENSNFKLYLNEETLGIKVENKSTGHIWNSTIDVEEEGLNQVWQGIAESAVTVEFMNEKGKIERLSVSNSKPSIKINIGKDGFIANVNFKGKGIQFDLKVTLTDDSLNVFIDDESIKEEKEKVQLQAIYLYPFMGATRGQDTSGYMFVPDGSGGLVRLDEKNTIITEPYVNKIYGNDYGIKGIVDSDIKMNELEKIKYPVFGITHNVNENAFVAIVESGAEYGEINAYPSGITTEYNWITSKFIFRDSYFQPTNKKGDGMVVNQKARNNFDISVTYNFLNGDDANYVGMAKKYRNYLINNGILTKEEKSKGDIPLKLEYLMSENQKDILGRKLVEMTTVEDIRNHLAILNEMGISNFEIVARGWTNGGIGGASMNHSSFENKVGSKSEWKKLINELSEKNIDVYMYTDYLKAFDNTKGISRAKDSAQTISEQVISDRGFNYVAPITTNSFFNKEQEKFEKNNISNIAIDSLGNNLYSNYNKKNLTTRTEAIELYETMLAESKTNNALYNPNDYLWKYSDSYYGIPMSTSNYSLITDNVPFLQIVLKGYMESFVSELNFTAGSDEILLQMIDYGVYPSFYLTEEDSVKLINTSSNWLYTSKFEIWKDEISRQYNILNSALSNVEGESIEQRNILADGVVEVVYSNDIKIVVNYNDSNYEGNGIEVNAKDFKVIGVN